MPREEEGCFGEWWFELTPVWLREESKEMQCVLVKLDGKTDKGGGMNRGVVGFVEAGKIPSCTPT